MEEMWNNPDVNKEWTNSGEKRGKVRFSHDVEKNPYLSRVELRVRNMYFIFIDNWWWFEQWLWFLFHYIWFFRRFQHISCIYPLHYGFWCICIILLTLLSYAKNFFCHTSFWRTRRQFQILIWSVELSSCEYVNQNSV